MTIQDFFAYISRGDLSSRVFFLYTKERPIILISLLQQWVSTVHGISTIVLDAQSNHYEEMVHVLGQATLFDAQKLCIIYLNDYSAVMKKKLLAFLSTYRGPHGIICIRDEHDELVQVQAIAQFGKDKSVDNSFINNNSDKNVFVESNNSIIDVQPRIYCICETTVQYSQYECIVALLVKKSSLDERLQRQCQLFFDAFVQRKYVLTLERLCLIALYQQVVGRSVDDFFDQWAERIFGNKKTLFMFSSSFFARDAQVLERWYEIRTLYGIEFWTVFFLSQLWQAYVFVAQRACGQVPTSSRLPFSFIKKDWQHCSVDQLSAAYQRMYDIDCLFKQGLCSDEQIDGFIVWWLSLPRINKNR